jgi:hypothetical protein
LQRLHRSTSLQSGDPSDYESRLAKSIHSVAVLDVDGEGS